MSVHDSNRQGNARPFRYQVGGPGTRLEGAILKMPQLLVFLSIPLIAHDLYFLPPAFRVKPGEKIKVAFHNGDAFPDSEAKAPIARLHDLQALSKAGATPITGLRETDHDVVGEAAFPGAGDIILAARTIPNFIQLEPLKFEEYLKEEGLDHVLRWRAEHGEAKLPGKERYSKYAKSLLLAGEPSGYFNHVVGFPIEIVPEANPSLLRGNAALPVQVLFRGKPVEGIAVESAFAPATGGKAVVKVIGKTDTNGRANVPIMGLGRWRIHALVMERCAEPAAADWESFWASLTFENR